MKHPYRTFTCVECHETMPAADLLFTLAPHSSLIWSDGSLWVTADREMDLCRVCAQRLRAPAVPDGDAVVSFDHLYGDAGSVTIIGAKDA